MSCLSRSRSQSAKESQNPSSSTTSTAPVPTSWRRSGLGPVVLATLILALFSPITSQASSDDLNFTTPTSVKRIYRALAEAQDFRVVFDPKVKDQKVVIDLVGMEREDALRVLARAVGHFTMPMDGDSLLVADDTPQMRRTYETQVVQVFHLQNLSVGDAMTVLRSILGLKHVAAEETARLIVVRDTSAVVEVAARVLSRIDKPRGEVEVAVEIFHLDAAQRSQLQRAWELESEPSAWPQRLNAEQLMTLRRQARLLASPSLSVLDGKKGLVLLKQGYELPSSDEGKGTLEMGVEFSILSRVHANTAATTLTVDLGITDLYRQRVKTPYAEGPLFARRRLNSQARLDAGQSLLIQGILEANEASSTLPRLLTGKDVSSGEILAILTPKVVRQPEYSASDLEALCVGTETNIDLCS